MEEEEEAEEALGVEVVAEMTVVAADVIAVESVAGTAAGLLPLQQLWLQLPEMTALPEVENWPPGWPEAEGSEDCAASSLVAKYSETDEEGKNTIPVCSHINNLQIDFKRLYL